MSKIVELDPNKPGINSIIKELQSNQNDIESVLIVFQKKSGEYDVAYNFQSVKNLVFMSKIAQLYVDRMMLGEDEED